MTNDWLTAPCPPPSGAHAASAEARQNVLTKPKGALGVLEHLAIRLAALQQTDRPRADNVRIVLFAGDHGITAQGVSAYPSAVTVQMLENFARGGAAICVLARELGAPLEVIDAGTLAASEIVGVMTDKPCCGTRDFSREPAMTMSETQYALMVGRRAAQRAADHQSEFLILGEIGIGNTTSAAAIAAALLARPPADLAGAGTGLDAEGVRYKTTIIANALELHGLTQPDVHALKVLTHVGGLEIAALTGAIVGAAQLGVPVLIDGFIVTVAALLAIRLNASCRDWLIYSHRSSEQGHRLMLDALGAEPILDLKLRLGEGSGAALALPIVRLACALHAQMATFAEANVSGSRVMPLLDLIRHGETQVPGLLLGRTDIALSESGWQQFEQQTASRTWQSVVASPLRRAREPAEKLALLRHLPLRIDADWAEIDFGCWDGRPLAELRADPVVSKQLDALYGCAAALGPPEGETWSALRSRVVHALLRLLDAPASERILVSTHAGPIRAVLSAACDMPFERTWAFRIAHGTRLTLRVERQDDGRPWGEIIEIAQP